MKRRTLRILLGMLWLGDGLLQLQPRFWTSDLVTKVLTPNLSGQPAPLQALLRRSIGLAGGHVILFNGSIVAVQVLLGIALLRDWRPRLALAASVLWSLGIWVLGEGLGGLLTGAALFLSGAPGAVLIYAVLALAAWPEEQRHAFSRVGNWPRAMLALLWLLAAALQLQSVYRAKDGLAQVIAGNAEGEPALLHASLHWAAGAIAGHGLELTLALALLQLALGLGLIWSRDRRPWLAAGILWALCAWWFGQALGQLFTGLGTDPNIGPLVVLLTLAIWPQSALQASQPRLPEPFAVPASEDQPAA